MPFHTIRWLRLQSLKQIRQKQAEARSLRTDALLMMVGNMTLSWAMVERILDELIAYWQHAATDLEREHPRGLTEKLKYLKRMQKDERLTDPIREWLRRTRIEANRLGNERHEIVHGIVHRDSRVGPEWHAQRVVYDGAVARLSLRPFTDGDHNKLIADISSLLADISPKVWLLARGDAPAFAPEIMEKAKRELGLIE